MSRVFTPVLSNMSKASREHAMNAIQASPGDQEQAYPQLMEAAVEVARLVDELLPDGNWVVETDSLGMIRLHLFFPTRQ